MCEPTTIALLVGAAADAAAGTAATAGLIGTAGAVTASGALTALSAVSGIAGLAGQVNAQHAQEGYNARQAQNLMDARGQNANQINLERSQATDAAGQRINANNQELREAQSTTIARAGPSGLSVDALLSDMGRKGATYDQSVTSNLDRTNMQLDSQLTNVNNQTSSAFNQMKTPASPDYLGTALKIGQTYQAANKTS